MHDVEQIAVCNLASLALNRYVTSDRKFDFKQLEYVTSVVVKNLNKIIDVNYYPVPEVTVSVWLFCLLLSCLLQLEVMSWCSFLRNKLSLLGVALMLGKISCHNVLVSVISGTH